MDSRQLQYNQCINFNSIDFIMSTLTLKPLCRKGIPSAGRHSVPPPPVCHLRKQHTCQEITFHLFKCARDIRHKHAKETNLKCAFSVVQEQ